MMAVSPLSAAQIEVGATDIKGGKKGGWGREINREIGQETTSTLLSLAFEEMLGDPKLYKERVSREHPGVSLFLLGSRHLLASAIYYSGMG